MTIKKDKTGAVRDFQATFKLLREKIPFDKNEISYIEKTLEEGDIDHINDLVAIMDACKNKEKGLILEFIKNKEKLFKGHRELVNMTEAKYISGPRKNKVKKVETSEKKQAEKLLKRLDNL